MEGFPSDHLIWSDFDIETNQEGLFCGCEDKLTEVPVVAVSL